MAVNLALVDSYSWFRNTSFSCDTIHKTDTVQSNSSTANHNGCIMDFRYVEVIQAGFQIMLAVSFHFALVQYPWAMPVAVFMLLADNYQSCDPPFLVLMLMLDRGLASKRP